MLSAVRGNTFVGNLCKRKHDNGAGCSLRYAKGGGCVSCLKISSARQASKNYKKAYRASEKGRQKIKEYAATSKAKAYASQYRLQDQVKQLKNTKRKEPKERQKINNYRSQPHVRQAENARIRKKRKSNSAFAIRKSLGARLADALRHQKTNKCILKKAGVVIDYGAIINHLGPCPGPRKDWHVDHIRPLCSFDLADPQQVIMACQPENHQWLPARVNQQKGGRFSS